MFNPSKKKREDLVEKNRDLRKQLQDHEAELFTRLSEGSPDEVQKLAKSMLKMLVENGAKSA